jgi:hypothetical protein
MVNQNIFEQIIGCIMRIKQINKELRPLLDRFVEVMTIIGDKSIQKHQDFSS